MHYMFENESKLRAFLHNVSCRLVSGGFFIGTTIDSDQLLTRMRSKGTQGSVTTTLCNEFYQIKLGQLYYPKDRGPYGLQYYFYLKEAIGIDNQSQDRRVFVPEYLVIFEHLEKLAAEYNLQLVEKTNFAEFYEKRTDQVLFDRMVWDKLDANNTIPQSNIDQ